MSDAPVQAADQSLVVMPSSVTMSMDIEAAVELAERQVALQKRVMTIALKLTTHRDWVDQNGKPFMCASGAEKIAPKFSVSLTDVKDERFEREDELGKFYLYRYTGTASSPHFGRLEGLIGTCSSRDQFFAYVNVWEGGQKTKVLRPMSEIDEGNIMKAAYSNLLVNAVTRLLGLRNITWEVVAAAGVDITQIAHVKYEQKSKGPDKGGTKAPAAGRGEMSDTKRKLGEKIIELVHAQFPALTPDEVKEKARELLEKYSAYTDKEGKAHPGLRSLTDLSEGRAKSTLGRVMVDWELICKQEEEGTDPEEATDGDA